MTIVEKLDAFYEKLTIEEAIIDKTIFLEGKNLDSAMTEQIIFQQTWEDLVAEISTIHNSAESRAEHKFSYAFKQAMNDKHRDLNATECKHIANSDSDYVKYKEIENRAYGYKKRAEGKLNLIESRKYILKDLAALVINGLEKHII